MAESTDNTKVEENTTRARERETILLFWLSVWGGMIAAGGVFGFLVACGIAGLVHALHGSFIGMMLVSVVGMFTIVNVEIVTWCFWLSRFRIAMGCLAGGLTGVIISLPIVEGEPFNASWNWLALSGVLGTLGGGLAGCWYHSRAKALGRQQSRHHRWRFTLRDLFIRVTVIAALLAAYVFVINLILTDQP